MSAVARGSGWNRPTRVSLDILCSFQGRAMFPPQFGEVAYDAFERLSRPLQKWVVR